jgi:hypothetical protein
LGVIYSSYDALVEALGVLERRFGQVLMETTALPCSTAALYGEEMGEELYRRFFCFEQATSRDCLPEIKQACHKIEPMFADRSAGHYFRTVNIDPGILSPDNLVIASHRAYNHRIYLRDGIYAELELVYARDRFVRLPWTTDDYCHAEAIEMFGRARDSFAVLTESQNTHVG